MNKSYQESGNKFIDHSHDDLFGFMDTMTFFVRDEWDVDSFKSLANDFIDQLENHFSREAIILKCADFQYLDERIINHRELALQVRIRIMDICD